VEGVLVLMRRAPWAVRASAAPEAVELVVGEPGLAWV
jgi:hypothetical protein